MKEKTDPQDVPQEKQNEDIEDIPLPPGTPIQGEIQEPDKRKQHPPMQDPQTPQKKEPRLTKS